MPNSEPEPTEDAHRTKTDSLDNLRVNTPLAPRQRVRAEPRARARSTDPAFRGARVYSSEGEVRAEASLKFSSSSSAEPAVGEPGIKTWRCLKSVSTHKFCSSTNRNVVFVATDLEESMPPAPPCPELSPAKSTAKRRSSKFASVRGNGATMRTPQAETRLHYSSDIVLK